MLKIRSAVYQVAPIIAALMLLASSSEASTVVKNKADSLNEQNQSNSNNINRQVDLFDYLDNVKLSKDGDLNSILQTNSVEQLKDINPTDWSYQALQNLIERYGCISGFEDNTFRGRENITRSEFAAGLNSCLNSLEKIISQNKSAPQADIDTVLRLMQEFQSELAIIQGRTDGSQARLLDLEATQFSSTTKLQGEVIFGLNSVLSDDRASTVLGNRTRLELKSSFQGDDLLFTRLSQGNFSGFADETGTFQGSLAFAEADDSDFRLDALHYSFGIGDSLGLIIGAAGLEADDIAPTINSLDGDGGSGAVSRFGTRNPLYYPPGDAGIGINHRPSEGIKLSAGYVASPAGNPNTGSGLFNGPYSALGQITVEPFESLSLAATYIHSYNQTDTETGTSRANFQSQTESDFGESIPSVSNSYGLELSWAISDRLIIGGWGGLSKVSNLSTPNENIDRGTQDIWNWAATLAVPDLGREGSLAGIVVGSEPKVTNSTIDNLEADPEQSLHLEAFYQYQVNDNIAITPGVIWITEPDSSMEDNDDLVIGTVRTTFSF
ncbi:MAG: iron uptake porin [Cyanobacteria bacterium J06600_6]